MCITLNSVLSYLYTSKLYTSQVYFHILQSCCHITFKLLLHLMKVYFGMNIKILYFFEFKN